MRAREVASNLSELPPHDETCLHGRIGGNREPVQFTEYENQETPLKIAQLSLPREICGYRKSHNVPDRLYCVRSKKLSEGSVELQAEVVGVEQLPDLTTNAIKQSLDRLFVRYSLQPNGNAS